ncbi:E3 ubiquitin-protein ligase RNF144A-like isoform X2 [Macadamia integrifolia]|nr:E3 ubiquitin-protein ligase RNF144A-like isoform X2 [Macadamia integrifolia]
MMDQHAQENKACRGRKMKKQCESSKEPLGDGDVRPIEIIDIEKAIEVIDIENVLLYTPISLRGRDKKDPILVEQYAEDRELQQAIHTSILQDRSIIDLSDGDGDEVEEITPNRVLRFRKTAFPNPSVTEIGQSSKSNSSMTETGETSSSNDPTFVCEICVEQKSQSELFNIKGCTHSYCSECMVRYVASKIQENITSIQCPESNCKGVLEPEFCQSILPPEVFDRWGSALCESLFLGSPKLYCPYKDCSALLLDDGGVVVEESECPNCRRLFCAQCKVPWHSGIVCKEFQKLNENERAREDIMLMQLAKQQKWQRCPKCKVVVERIDGCLYMKCRCGYAFCYNCGAQMIGNNHYCTICRH